jgi:hypothetical protein
VSDERVRAAYLGDEELAMESGSMASSEPALERG